MTDFARDSPLDLAAARSAERSAIPKPSNPSEPACSMLRRESTGCEKLLSRGPVIGIDPKRATSIKRELI